MLLNAVALALSAAAPAGAFAACEERVAQAPQSLESWACYREVARRAGRHEEASRRLRARVPRERSNPAARLALAFVLHDLAHDEARAHFRAAAEGFAARGEAEGEVRALLGLCATLHARGARQEADAALEQARAAAERSADAVLRARVSLRQASRHYRDGDFGRARQALQAAQGAFFPHGPRDQQASWLMIMGNVLWAIGSAEDTVRHWEEAAAVLHAAGDFYEEARVRASVLFLLPDLQRRPPERRARAEELRALAVASGSRWAEGQAHRELAQLTSGAERIAHARRFLELARRTAQPVDVAEALRLLGLYLAPRDREEAFRLLDAARAVSREVANPALDAWNAMVRGEARWRSGPRPDAVADSLAALDAVEAMRNLQPDTQVRARAFARWAAPYTRLAGHLLAGHLRAEGESPSPADLELAFHVTERRRARVLLDGLDAAQATGAAAAGGEAARRRNEVLGAIASVQRRLLTPALDASTRRRLAEDLARLEREEEELRDALARADPRFAIPPPSRVAALPQVQAALGAGEALIAYQVAPLVSAADDQLFEGGSWAFIITRSDVRAVPLDAAPLEALPLFLGLFERRDGSEAAAAARVFGALVEPALAALPAGVRRLVVVPDGPLHQVPLATLGGPGQAPLGSRYELTQAPSATVWLRLRRTGASSEAPVLALADPAVAAPAPHAAPERAWSLDFGARLGPLPRARAESRFLVRTLGGGSVLLEGTEATESFLKSAPLRRYAVIHLAAHALVDDDRPLRSAVLLAPGAPGEDGLLQIREIAGLDLGGRVVVLAACRSAAGPVLSGEGVLGLAQAFFQAGARAVVGSLWPMRDDEAERIFRSFYRGLARGESVACALASARRDAIAAGLPAAAWAGVVVLGDGEAVPVPGGVPRRWWPVWVAAGGVFAAAGMMLRFRRSG